MSEILDFQEGREARMHGKPRDKRRNQHWLLGWDFVNADLAATSDDEKELGISGFYEDGSPY
jgi:hypothetical protein